MPSTACLRFGEVRHVRSDDPRRESHSPGFPVWLGFATGEVVVYEIDKFQRYKDFCIVIDAYSTIGRGRIDSRVLMAVRTARELENE